MTKLNITQWAEEDRPREKMLQKGASILSNAELFAILIGSGSSDESAVSLMQRVLASCNNDLSELSKLQLDNFLTYKGLGTAKSLTIMAALELAKRYSQSTPSVLSVIHSSADVFRLFHPLMRDLPTEEFWVLLLNQASRVIDKVCISKGGIDHTTADVRLILREALLCRATQIILVHNHPSGNERPSAEDRRITETIKKSAELMNIRLTDHLIVTEQHFFSFSDEGMM